VETGSPHFINVGRGVYTLAEAEYLTRVPRWSIRRWTRGYSYIHRGERLYVPPVIGRDETTDTGPVLNFADLVEVRFLHAFRSHGVSWHAIRVAAYEAKELLGRTHPFSTKLFKSDGRTILGEIGRETNDKVLLDMVSSQYTFEAVVKPYLYAELEYGDFDNPKQWFPLGQTRLVVIDPLRSFGAPIVIKSGIPTRILSNAVKTENSVDFVARWYDASLEEVKDAVEYESRLAA
jgi:uncharacterized protein (DUF433 family)